MKRFTIFEAVVGKKAVVGPSVDTTVYTIKAVHNYQVHLVYFEYGQEINGGWIDVACLYHPTDDQLNAQLLQALN